MVSTANLAENIASIQASLQNMPSDINLLVLPENFACFSIEGNKILAKQEMNLDGPLVKQLSQWAITHKIWVLAGSIALFDEASQKCYAASLLFNSAGEIVARYNKIHLFDVDVTDGFGSYRESDSYVAGDDVVVAQTPWGKLGMAICYDLRFPELFRKFQDQGADFVVLPSAFTWVTGKAHWEVLLRARAIENQCFMLACNQGGWHDSDRRTWGGTMAIDPWGEVIDQAPDGHNMVIVTLDKTQINELKQKMPCQKHRRL
jgi:nitrilase